MLSGIYDDQSLHGVVYLRKHLQNASLNNIMGTVFGKRYDLTQFNEEAKELQELVIEGFELLGAFNWSDYLPWLNYFYDPFRIKEHVLLSLEGEEKLEEDDMVAVLWEMIFRGTDTTALLTEWVMAELVLNPEIQAKLSNELKLVVGNRRVTDADAAELPYLQAVIKETLRVHPPGPLLSWARLSTSDVHLRLVTVSLWVAKLVHHFEWVQDMHNPVDLSEMLKLSCEMKQPLSAVAIPRN
ncbi:CYTOCHROME P450 78A7-RELATED [Salix koriyanagi]|uniref:CYTOCHROME P450 78A7-RELATED n=1 Tax=Salix koriyanagi TaxID=2511006 RepID=A0A9Q0QMA0_9ROSI|nr:CYTOCHROME P450 78A7-RELATED [Salix koriyanagi]